MPHFWLNNDDTGRWGLQPLAGESRLAVASAIGAGVRSPAGATGAGDLRLLPPDAANGATAWTLLAGRAADVRVNGRRLVLGIRALRDRDEISLAGVRWFFSTEELAVVAPFPGLAQPAFCPRCKQKLEPGGLAVACPHCHAWHHQSEKFPCWTYGATCALCQIQSTALDAGYAWTPDQL